MCAAGTYNILWLAPLPDDSEFHLYYDIWASRRAGEPERIADHNGAALRSANDSAPSQSEVLLVTRQYSEVSTA